MTLRLRVYAEQPRSSLFARLLAGEESAHAVGPPPPEEPDPEPAPK